MTRIVQDNSNVTLHITQGGAPFAGATVTISGAGDVYSDQEMTTVITSVTTDGGGDAHFYAPPGTYTFTCSGADSASLESVEVLGEEVGAQRGLRFKRSGTATLSSGSVTVSDTSITANSIILLAHKTKAGTTGALYISAKTASTSFVISSTSGSDTSVVAYYVLKD